MGRGKKHEPSQEERPLVDKAPNRESVSPTHSTRHQQAIQAVTSIWGIESPEFAIPVKRRPLAVTDSGDFVDKSLTQALHGIAELEPKLWKVHAMIEEEYQRTFRAGGKDVRFHATLADLTRVYYRLVAEKEDMEMGEDGHLNVEGDDEIEELPGPPDENPNDQLMNNHNTAAPTLSVDSPPSFKRRRDDKVDDGGDESITRSAPSEGRRTKRRRTSDNVPDIAGVPSKRRVTPRKTVRDGLPTLNQVLTPVKSEASVGVDAAPAAQTQTQSPLNPTTQQPSYPEYILLKPAQFEYIKDAAQQRMIPHYADRIKELWGLVDATSSIPEHIRPSGSFEQWSLGIAYAIYYLARQSSDPRFIQTVHSELQTQVSSLPRTIRQVTASHTEAVVARFMDVRNAALARQKIEDERNAAEAKAKRAAKSQGSSNARSRSSWEQSRKTAQEALLPPAGDVRMEESALVGDYMDIGDHLEQNLGDGEEHVDMVLPAPMSAGMPNLPSKRGTRKKKSPKDANEEKRPSSRRLAKDYSRLLEGLEKEPQMQKPRPSKASASSQPAHRSALQPVQTIEQGSDMPESDASTSDEGLGRVRDESIELGIPNYGLQQQGKEERLGDDEQVVNGLACGSSRRKRSASQESQSSWATIETDSTASAYLWSARRRA